MTEESRLLQSSINGDTAAFEKIVTRYQAMVCAITFSGTGRVDISEDLAQETFLSAWKNLAQLKNPGGFRAWLCAIARNVLHNHYRQKKTVSLDQSDPDAFCSGSENPSETLIHQEELAMLEQAMMQIPVEYREPLVMFYRQHQSTRQVAESLGLNESTVRTRLHRARQMLREEIAARLEKTLEQTAPGKAFTKTVMAAVASGLAASAAGTASAAAGTATSAATGLTAAMSTVTAKIILVAAVAAIASGAVFAYKQLSQSAQPLPSDEFVAVSAQHEPIVTIKKTQIAQSEIEQIVAIPTEFPEAQTAAIPSAVAATAEPLSIPQTTQTPEVSAYVFEPNGVLSGLITDAETGEPVTDAELVLGGSRYYSKKADKNGFYSIKTIHGEGSFRIEIYSKQYVGITEYEKLPTIYLKEDSQEIKHFKLDKACLLDVWVVDEEGSPLKDARVCATSLADDFGPEIGHSMYSRKTDENGYILLGGFPPSKSPYLITIMHYHEKTVSEKNGIRLTKAIANHAYAGERVILDDPNTILSIRVVLKKGASVRGYAEYLDGVPACGLDLRVYPDWWHSNNCPGAWPIEPNGFFTAEQIVPGNYNLQISIPTGEGRSIGKHLFSTHLPLPDGELLKVTVPEKSPKSLVSVSGTVNIKGEKTPSYISISAYSRQYGHHSTDLDLHTSREKSISFSLDRLEPGTYRLKFEGSDIEPVTMDNVQAPCDNIDVELIVVGKPRLAGRVVDAETDKPVTNFQVRVRKLKTHRGPNYVQNNQWTEFRNEKGTFEIDAVGPGAYQVQVSAEGYAAQWSNEIDTDRTADVVLKLIKGGSIRGTVVDSAGKPVRNATIIPLSLAGGTNLRTAETFVSTDGGVKTDMQGQFTLSHLPEGSETLKVTHAEYADEIVQTISVQLNQITDVPPMVLGKGASIEGYVYDAIGKPESGVTLYIQDDNGYSGTDDELAGRLGITITDPNGFYHVSNLPEKMCYLRRQNEGTSLGVVRRTVMPQNGKTSRIHFGGKGILTGQIIIEGKPLPNTRIQLAPAGQPHFGSFKAFAFTDTNGYFTFYPGIAGLYTVYTEIVQPRDWRELTTVTLSPDLNIDLGIIPEHTSLLKIYFNQPADGPAWQIDHVFVQRGANQAAARIATAVAPANAGDPYTASGLLPGTYAVKLYRSDMLIFHAAVHIQHGDIESDLIIDLPVCKSVLTVNAAAGIQYLRLFSEDDNIQKTLSADEFGLFKADNLPAGDYKLANGALANNYTALAEFSLLDGQVKTVDISSAAGVLARPALLQVEVVDENGSTVNGCRVWLEGPDGTVEPTIQLDFETSFIASADNYVIHTAHPGYQDAGKQVSLIAIELADMKNQQPQRVLLRLTPLSD